MPSSTLRISLFGTPQLIHDEQSWPLPTPAKVFSLLALLLLNPGQAMSRDMAAATLWPDVSDSEARANLRRHLHLLQKQLPAAPKDASWILTTRNTLQWNSESAYELDVAQFDAFDPGDATDPQWAKLIDLYQGDLMEGVYDDWVLPERTQRQSRFVQLLGQLIDHQLTAGKLQDAVQTATRLVTHDPLLEEPYRCLMELHYRLGDRAAALNAYEKCQQVLQAELGVEPMAETLALRDRIASGEQLPPLASAPKEPPVPVHQSETPAKPSQLPVSPSKISRWWLALPVVAVVVAVGLWLAGVFNPAGQQVNISIYGPAAVQDTWLNFATPDLAYDPDYQEDGSYADFPQVHLQYFNYPYDRMLIRFDLHTLPAGVQIDQAIFRIRLEPFLNKDLPEARPATFSAFRVLTPWQVTNATFSAPWTQPGLAPGVDYQLEAAGSQSINEIDWLSIDVTALVRAWIEEPAENQGIVLMITEAPQGAHYWVDTADHPLSNRQPRLDISYTD